MSLDVSPASDVPVKAVAAARMDRGPLRDAEIVPFTAEEIEGSIAARFARIARARPAALAIVEGPRRATYGELDQQSDRLAAALVDRLSGCDEVVAVLADDQISAITGMLTVWKAGKLCVPLDAALPRARLEVILRDAAAGLVITDQAGSATVSTLPGFADRQLRVDQADALAPVESFWQPVTPDRPACLLYTSGSTGEPKGLVRSHRSLLYRARSASLYHGFTPADRVSAVLSPSFAAGLHGVLAALLSGAALLPFDLHRAGLRALADWIDREQISVLSLVVTTFRHLITEIGADRRFPSVRLVRLSSEPSFRQDVERFRGHFEPGCLLVVTYGASEAAGIAEYRMTHETPVPPGRVPAGYPHEGVEILVLGDDGNPVADGETGEVVVRSRYLSDGYWRRPDLTRAAFQTDCADPRARLYRTGDIGRLQPDGCLHLVGRRDHQVKVRGYRVHPGELECALAEHPGVREAVVKAWEGTDRQTRLVAYVVPEASPGPGTGTLREFLRARLPTYMLPSAVTTLEALPVGPNGKLDREALPPPPEPTARREGTFVPPRTPLEHQVAAVWEDLFDLRPIGAEDDFFDLGGDSLLAAALVAGIEEACGRALPPFVLLEAPTVTKLAAALLREEEGFDDPLTALRASGLRAPVFFVHNDLGRGLYTHGLARALHPDRPFYAVHLHGLTRRVLPATVEAMAADRLLALRAERPRGPYVLGGHCYGGIVALEMARQLRSQGEHVAAVVLVDTRAPGLGRRILGHAFRMLTRLRGLPPDARSVTSAHLARASETIALRARYYQKRFRHLGESGLQAWAALAGRKLARAGDLIARWLGNRPAAKGSTVTRGAPAAMIAPVDAYRHAIRCYVPSPYDGPVALFRAEEFPASRPDLGWSRLLSRLEVVVVPGSHHSCVTRHVTAFAAILEDVLQRLEGGA